MVYYVSNQQQLFTPIDYTLLSVENSLQMLQSWNMIQYDSETTGRDCHINQLLLMQFGNMDGSIQIVVDCTTVDPLLYKDILESKYLIGQNIKFDLKFLYNYSIKPLKVYDTMIVEQLIYLAYPHFMIGALRI